MQVDGAQQINGALNDEITARVRAAEHAAGLPDPVTSARREWTVAELVTIGAILGANPADLMLGTTRP